MIFLHIVHLTFWCTPDLFSHSPPASFSQFLHSPAPLLHHLRQVKWACGHLHGVKLCYPSGHWRWLGPLTHAVQAAMFHVMWWKQKPFFKTTLSQTFPSIFTFMTTWTENPFSLCLRLLWLLFLFCRMVFKLKKRFPCAYLTGGRKWTPCWWGGGGGVAVCLWHRTHPLCVMPLYHRATGSFLTECTLAAWTSVLSIVVPLCPHTGLFQPLCSGNWGCAHFYILRDGGGLFRESFWSKKKERKEEKMHRLKSLKRWACLREKKDAQA